MNAVHRLRWVLPTLRAAIFGAVAIGIILPATAAVADPSLSEIERQLDKAHDDLEDIVEDHNRITEELKATDAASTELLANLGPLQTQLDAAQSSMAGIATQAYKTGGTLPLANALLTANSSNALVHHVTAIDRVARARQREIAGYTEKKTRFEQERKRLDVLRAEQAAKQQQLAARRVTIEADIKKLEELERRAEEAARRANRPRGGAAPPPPPPPPSGTGRGATAVKFAYAQLGKMYRWGASGPGNYDCSGLTMRAWASAGVSLPHNAAMQYQRIAKVSRSNLQPGDLVFYRNLGHVGIYIGSNKIIHASRTGQPVAVAALDRSPPYGYGRPG